MTVFGTVTASLSPSLSTYIQCKGKAWKAGFITSLETMAGVEYTVYKKKGCWQIKGDWENVKHAHRILTKVTKAEDWNTCQVESKQLQGHQEAEARPPLRPSRRRACMERRGAKRYHPGQTVSGDMTGPNVAMDTIKTEPIEHITNLEPVENKVTTDVKNTDGENTLSSAIINYVYGNTVINESEVALDSTPTKGTGIEQQIPHFNEVSEGHSSGITFKPVCVQESPGSRRKRGRPRKVEASYTVLDEYKKTPVIFEDRPVTVGDTMELLDSTELPIFTDSDNKAEDSDPSNDPDFNIDKMVEDGKAKLKDQSHGKSYSCSICQFSCTTQHGVTEHKKRQHAKKTLKCPICNKAYGVKRDLQKHIRRHTAEYKCEQCGKTYKEDRTYKNHMKTHEDDYAALRFSCEQCPKSFTTPYVLKAHVDQVHNGKVIEYLCTTCGKKFKQKHSLAEHNLIHTGERPYACKICHKTFRHKGACVNHERLHSDLRLFTCEICGKDFKHRNSLRIHASVHETNRNYECNICNKKFTQKQALIRHSRIHSGEKPFMCELCGDRFNDSSIIRRHMMGVHKTEYKPEYNHFVMPAEHYQAKQDAAKSESDGKKQQLDTPMDVGTVMNDLKAEGHQSTLKLQQQGEQLLSGICTPTVSTPLSLEDYSVGHIASSMTNPYILQEASPYSLFPQTERASNPYSNLPMGPHVSSMGMPVYRDIPFTQGISSSLNTGAAHQEGPLPPVTMTPAGGQSNQSELTSHVDKPHTMQPY